jgi:hypothetical protein
MFEIIGLMFVTLAVFAISGLIGLIYGLLAWMILRKGGRRAPKASLVFSFLLPPFCAVYLCVFSLVWSISVPAAHESVFGDISEPLPNGYTLVGLAKMPDYAYVGAPDSDNRAGTPSDIGRIAVEGPLVYASISRSFGEPEKPNDGRGFYVFDTRSGKGTRFDTLDQMQAAAGHKISLAPTMEFKTQDRTTVLVRRAGRILLLVPPIATLFLYLAYLVYLRRSREIQFA